MVQRYPVKDVIQVSGSVAVASGLYFASGLYVVADIQSGAHVWISGQHVYVESGVYTIANINGYYQQQQYWSPIQINLSGRLLATVSGDHVFVESGVYIASGLYVQGNWNVKVGISGEPVTISGDHVFVESGVYTASGVGVVIQSGVYLASGLFVNTTIVQASLIGVSSGEIHVISGSIAVYGFDLSGAYRPVLIDRDTDSLSVIDSFHSEIHGGDTFRTDVIVQAVVDSGLVTAVYCLGSGKEAHMKWSMGAGGEAWPVLYENVTANSGILMPLINVDRYAHSGKVSVISGFHTPSSITASGNQIAQTYIFGGNTPQTRIGGEAETKIEWILSPNTTYAVRVRNMAGSAKPIMIAAEYYEVLI